MTRTTCLYAGLLALLGGGCAKDGGNAPGPTQPAAQSPFASVEVAAQASERFTSPRAGTPLPGGGVAFVAMQPATEETASRAAVLRGAPGEEPSVLYAGELLQNPLDLDVSTDGATLYVADSLHLDAEGNSAGALLLVPVGGGDPTAAALGYAPRAVTVADSGDVYFSGRDPESREPGVFRLYGDAVETVYAGAPLVDPSGIAVASDGRVFVADTSLSDAEDSTLASRAGVLAVGEGRAELFVTGFETGYPAGIALTSDDSALIVSGQGSDSSNLVYVFATATPEAAPYVETAFANQHWSSAGLHREHGANRFAWCDRAAEGGTVYAIAAR
ncbi:MAG TPA: hypothetical protein VGK73_00890 [Polyangiaceae bacterium]